MSGTPQSGAASQGGRGPRARTPNPRYSASPAGTPSGALLLDKATSKQGSTPRPGAAKVAPAARAAKPAPAKAPSAANGAFKPVGIPGIPPKPPAKPRGLAPALAAARPATALPPPAAAAPQRAQLDSTVVLATAQQRQHDLTAPLTEPPAIYTGKNVKKRYVWKQEGLAHAVGLVR